MRGFKWFLFSCRAFFSLSCTFSSARSSSGNTSPCLRFVWGFWTVYSPLVTALHRKMPCLVMPFLGLLPLTPYNYVLVGRPEPLLVPNVVPFATDSSL